VGYGHYLSNNLDVAASHLVHAAELRYNGNRRAAIDALALLALTYQARQQPAEANKTVDLLLDFAVQHQTPAVVAVARSCQARLALLQGDLEAATRWLRTADTRHDRGVMVHWAELPRLTTCRVLITQGSGDSLQEAVEKLRTHLKTAEDQHNTLHIIEILSLQSLAYQAQGQVNEALRVLKRAVVLAQPGGFIRTFVDSGLPLAGLLRQLARQGVAPDYVRQILAAFPDLQARSNLEHLSEPLTDRELEILELLARRLSNREIGQLLDISILTVKSHATHIYRKMGVKRRHQAVAKARSLNLLPADNDKNGRPVP
jgi:LuxR family maltose regulon positive regulatory protein